MSQPADPNLLHPNRPNNVPRSVSIATTVLRKKVCVSWLGYALFPILLSSLHVTVLSNAAKDLLLLGPPTPKGYAMGLEMAERFKCRLA